MHCDICGLAINGEALEIQHIRGRLIATTEGGKPRFIDRKNGATLRYACDSCGSWIDAAIAHLARSLRESGLAA